jgi:hypothetical protein
MDTHAELVLQDVHPAAEFLNSPALGKLIAIGCDPEPFSRPHSEIQALQLQAAREVIASQKPRVHVLNRRIDDTGAGKAETMEDLVPLLFAHTIYKSYPISFLKKGQWDKLLRFLNTLSSTPIEADISGVSNVDDFILRLHAAGHGMMTSSGTSGKVSFLDRNDVDVGVNQSWANVNFCWPHSMPVRKMQFFQLTPRSGPYIAVAVGESNARRFSTPEMTHFLTDGRMLVGDLIRAAEMKQAMADGTATPGEIAAYEAEVKVKQAKAGAELEAIFELIFEHRHEPMLLMGQSGMLWRMLERARERGIPDGEFHPHSILATGGGAKGLKLPEDFMEQIHRFLGPIHHKVDVYGSSEMSVQFPACEHGHYHVIPWIIPFVLDREGEHLIEHGGGEVEGRFAFLDLSYNARWGGLITGDKVTMDYAETCSCGRSGPVVRAGSIMRYSDLGEEDKITCAATMESYIRGAID